MVCIPGVVLGFQVTGMIECGQKSKPQKIPGQKFNLQKTHAEFLWHKNFQKALNDIRRKTETSVLNTPETLYLTEAFPKNYLSKFSFSNKILKSKISTPPPQKKIL